MKIVASLLLLILCSLGLNAQLTTGFNYQAVARDGSGNILANSSVNLRFEIRESSATGTVVYDETHAITTNDYGLVHLILGNGNTSSGSFNGINWASAPHFLLVEMNGMAIDTAQFQDVPYARVATAMELGNLSDVNGSPMLDQVLTWDGSQWVPATQADADPTNELQSLSIVGNNLSISGGNTVSIPGFSGSVAGGDLGGTYPNPTVIALRGTSISSLTPSIGQVLQFNGSQWAPSAFSSASWLMSGNNIYYDAGNVGVGTNNPLTNFHVGAGDLVLFGGDLSTSGSKMFFNGSNGALTGGQIGGYNPADTTNLNSFSWGNETKAKGEHSAAFNWKTRALGNYSFAAGFDTYSPAYLQTTIGRYNVINTGSVATWVSTQPLFVIGNGLGNFNRNNALTLLKDGRLGLNEAAPSFFFHMKNFDLSTRSIYIDQHATTTSSSPQYGFYLDLDNFNSGSLAEVYGVFADVRNAGEVAYGLYGYGLSEASNSAHAYGVRAMAENDNGSGDAYGIFASVLSSSSSGTTYAGYFSGDVFSTGAYLPSDISLKTGIESSPSVLNKIVKLQIKSYSYRTDDFPDMNLPTGKRTGFIAQDIQKFMPELVKASTAPAATEEELQRGASQTEDVHYQAVDYAGMVPYLTKAIQEQQAIIEALKDQMKDMQAEIQQLKNN
ncbi:MAG: tail fiber domain-containing protein [Bacteroidota bacterium]